MTSFLTLIRRYIENEKQILFGLRQGFRLLAVMLAGLHTWAAALSHSMNPDGINYLDIGDAYFRGDWEMAINPVWPPLYSWLLGFVNLIFKPGISWEFPTVHIVNFFIFLFALVSFEFMWGKLENCRRKDIQDNLISLPAWAWWAVGYSLFIWTSLNLIQIWAVTPDMLMAAMLFLAAGMMIDIRKGSRHWLTFFLLGIILGLGYLTKTFMLSIALVVLGICLLLVERSWRSIAKVLFSLGGFLLISLPFIFLISEAKGKFTIGEAGTVTYMRNVYGIPFPHWQGDPLEKIELNHPSRLINETPPIFEFEAPIEGTYPISMDPSYWYDGIEMRFSLQNQLARILISSLFYLELFIQKQGALLACVIALYVMGPKEKLTLTEIIRKWALVIPAVIAFGLYGFILVAGRYVAAFVLLFWADILANTRLTNSVKNKSWFNILIVIAFLGLLTNIVIFNLDGINRLSPSVRSRIGEQVEAKPPSPLEVAQTLQGLDVKEGEKVAVIGYGFDSFWARLAKVSIIAEMLEEHASNFWLGEESLRETVLDVFASTGAKAIVAENVPAYAGMDDWHQVGNSSYYIYLFR
jgi:hypothetical protein